MVSCIWLPLLHLSLSSNGCYRNFLVLPFYEKSIILTSINLFAVSRQTVLLQPHSLLCK